MALTVADLTEHIITRRKVYALALAADIELLRRAYGESVVEEALRLADEAAQPKQAPQMASAELKEIADALDRIMAEPRRERNRLPVPINDQGGGKRPFRTRAASVFAHQLRQLGNIRRDAPRLVAGAKEKFHRIGS